MQELKSLFKREKEYLTRLAYGENSVDLLPGVPVYKRFDSHIIYLIVLCERRYHGRIDAVGNRLFHFLSLQYDLS